MATVQAALLYHVHDPMCSWCWGYRRSWDQLRTALRDTVTVVNVVGGLALRRAIGVYSFPSLVLAYGDRLIPIEIDYNDHLASLDLITTALQ